jgi:glycosyltransferase involved in cell wall biosynthesis
MKLKVNDEFSYNDIVPTIYSFPHPFLEPFQVISINRNNKKPKVSVIVPVFNKERIISEMLDKLIGSLTTDYELIIINDSSTDNSKIIVTDYLKNKNINHIFVSTTVPIFETACDNLGFFIAEGFYLLEVQSDMIIDDKGFDSRMIYALDNNKFSSVSGRSCHSWFDLLSIKKRIKNVLNLYSPPSLLLFGTKPVGLVENQIYENKLSRATSLHEIYKADTNCRGPWLINKDLLNEIGPLNTDLFFNGFDDHDFNLRGAKKSGYSAGYTPVLMSCDKNEGSGNQVKSGINKKIFEYLSENKLIHQKAKLTRLNAFIEEISIKKATKPIKI